MGKAESNYKYVLNTGHRATVGDRLKEYMSNHNLKQVDVIRKVEPYFTLNTKVTKTDLSQYINGKTEPRSDKLHILAKGLGVDEGWLMGFDTSHKSTEDKNITNIKYLEDHDKHIVRIPIIGTIACGTPITADQNIEGYTSELFTEEPDGVLFALRCKGDSMEPLIPNGAIVVVREQPEVENDEIAAVLVDDDEEATLKRVKHVGNQVMLLPENKKYDPILLNAENPGRILGKVIKVSYNL